MLISFYSAVVSDHRFRVSSSVGCCCYSLRRRANGGREQRGEMRERENERNEKVWWEVSGIVWMQRAPSQICGNGGLTLIYGSPNSDAIFVSHSVTFTVIRGTKIIMVPSPAAKTLYAIRKKSVRDSDFCNRKSSKFAKNPIFLEFLCRKCGFWAPKTRPNENASFFQQDPCRKPETAEGRSPVAVSGFRQGSISNYHISP